MGLKPSFAWALYDFANSGFFAIVPATVYAKHYALVVVGNQHGRGDLLWGLAVTTSMAIVALSAAPLGALADLTGMRKRLMLTFTYMGVAATALMATVGAGDVVWGWTLAVVACASIEAAIVFYNAYLPDLAPAERRGRLSAYGFALGYAGSALALVVALPFARHGSPSGAFLITAAFFALFAMPAFFYLPPDSPRALGALEAARAGCARARSTLRWIVHQPPIRRFLAAYLFFADGINTVIYFSSIFAAHTLGFSTTEVIKLYFVVQIAALAGAWFWARPCDVKGPKFVLMITLAEWCVIVIAAAAATTKGQFFAVAILAGTALGAAQAASRTFMAALIPAGREAELFGFYALCGKTAAIVGPLVFGLASWMTGGKQRIAVLAVGTFFVAGLALLAGVRSGGPPTEREGA